MQISKIEIKNFKRIKKAEIPLGDITYLVGGNSSGKSSVLQAVHMAVICGRKSLETQLKVVPDSSLEYSPTGDFHLLGNSGAYENRKDGSRGGIKFSGSTKEGADASYSIEIYKARNHNNVGIERKGVSVGFGTIICEPSHLFSVYVPGLSGIPHYEEMQSYASVLKRGAGGEANLVFRNILRLIDDRGKLPELHDILNDFLGECEYKISFDPDKDLYVDVKVSFDPSSRNPTYIPVDLVGTGAIQITQIVAYVILFRPKILLIDEPDNHLHPSRQAQLDKVFHEISGRYECRVVVSTHSRHLISSCSSSSQLVWMKDGKAYPQEENELASILMDLGALDQIDVNGADILVCTEDNGKKDLENTLPKNVGDKSIKVMSYNGVANSSSAFIIKRMSELLNKEPMVIIHRDRDFLTDEEVAVWAEPFENRGMAVFCPRLCDIESYLTLPEHLTELYDVVIADSQEIVSSIYQDNIRDITKKYRDKRREAVRTFWKDGGAPATDELWPPGEKATPSRVYGKGMLKLVNRYFFDKAVEKGYELTDRKNPKSIPSRKLREEFDQLLATLQV